jgi:hypothetical protein
MIGFWIIPHGLSVSFLPKRYEICLEEGEPKSVGMNTIGANMHFLVNVNFRLYGGLDVM